MRPRLAPEQPQGPLGNQSVGKVYLTVRQEPEDVRDLLFVSGQYQLSVSITLAYIVKVSSVFKILRNNRINMKTGRKCDWGSVASC